MFINRLDNRRQKTYNKRRNKEVKCIGKKMNVFDDSNNNTMKVDTNSLRNEKELTEVQIELAINYAVQLGMPKEQIAYSSYQNTSYAAIWDWLIIGIDLYPKENAIIGTDNANSCISWKGALAHEIIGHRNAAMKGLSQNSVLEEVQASLRAAKFTLDLTEQEREFLIEDAKLRLKKENLIIEDIEEKLFLWED